MTDDGRDPGERSPLRVLLVEDDDERRRSLRSIVREHAWVEVNTAARGAVLAAAFEWDVVFLDYDLDGPDKGSLVAEALAAAGNEPRVVVHSMSSIGAAHILRILPKADWVPFSRLCRSNERIGALRGELGRRGRDFEVQAIAPPPVE